MAFPAAPTNGQLYTTPSGQLYTYNTVSKVWASTSPAGTVPPSYINNATTSPLVTSDAAAGYVEGSVWVDTATGASFVCVDATNGAAVWVDSTAAGSGGVGGNVATDPAAPTLGQIWYNTTSNTFKTYVNVLGVPTIKSLVAL